MPNPEIVDESTEELEVNVDVEEGQEGSETEADMDGDFELVIDGVEQDAQQSEPTPAEKMQHAIIREKKRYKQERDEKNELKQELDQLKAQMAALQAPVVPQVQPTPVAESVDMPDPPNKMDYVSDAEYEKAKRDYAQKFQTWFQSMNKANQAESTKQAAQAKRASEVEQAVVSHFSRAAKFAEENKIPVEKYQAAEIKVRETLGSEVVDDLIAVVGEGAEKGIMLLGSNAGSLQNISALVSSGNSLKAVSEFTKLANRVTIKRGKKISQAPEPDSALHGDAATSASVENARKHHKKLIEDNNGDIRKAREYRKQMRERGIEF